MNIAESLLPDVPVANPDDRDWIFSKAGDPWYGYLICGGSGALCVAYESCLQNALDEAWDAGLLKYFAIDEETAIEWEAEGWEFDRLGNCGEPADLTSLVVYTISPTLEEEARWEEEELEAID